MEIINVNPDRVTQLGYEGEDKVTALRFRYGADWLENGEGIFHIRVRRHGENHAYNAELLTVDLTHMELLMTVTNVELSVKGSGEMQVVYSGADFVKKSPIYSYNVSRAVDEAVDPPAQDVYTEIIESLSDLQTAVQSKADAQDVADLETALAGKADADDVTALQTALASKADADDLSALQTTVQSKADASDVTALQTALASKADASDVTALETAMQSKADIQTVSTLSDAVNGLDGDIQSLQTGKADTSTVTALAGTVSGLQITVQSKADVQTVAALSDAVQGIDSDIQRIDEDIGGLKLTEQQKTALIGLLE